MYNRQYSIKNQSSAIVKLKFFRISNNQLINDIDLDINEIYSGENLETDQPHSNNLDNFEPKIAYPSGLLIIIFNQEKQKTIRWNDNGILFSAPIDRNVFRHGNYVNIGGDNFQFTLTEEDYNNATDCNGDCD